MSEQWISAAEAFKLVAAATGPREAPRSICSRAFAGMIHSKAARFVMDRESRDDFEIPKVFWWAKGEAALTQNWVTGDFESWIDHEIHLQAFGVLFLRKGIEAITAPAIGSLLLDPVRPLQNTGGRPAAAWWDDLWVEISRQLHAGDLQPKKQSDIETAMMEWAVANRHKPADSTIRERARKLWMALNRKDEN